MQKKSAPKTAKCRKKGVKGGETATKKRYTKTWKALKNGRLRDFRKRNGGNAGNGIFYISGSAKENSGTFGTLKKQCRFLKAEQKKEVEKVEVSLLNRCLGYNADIKKHMKVKKPMLGTGGEVLTDANGKVITEEVLEEVTEQQHVPADVGAIKFIF